MRQLLLATVLRFGHKHYHRVWTRFACVDGLPPTPSEPHRARLNKSQPYLVNCRAKRPEHVHFHRSDAIAHINF